MAGTVTKTRATNMRGEMRQIRYKLAVVGDASAGTVPNTTISDVKGYYLEEVLTYPGAGGAAPSAYTVDVQDVGRNNLAIIDLAARSTTATEAEIGSVTLGYYPKIEGNLTVIVGNVGNSKTTTIELLFTH